MSLGLEGAMSGSGQYSLSSASGIGGGDMIGTKTGMSFGPWINNSPGASTGFSTNTLLVLGAVAAVVLLLMMRR